jgi:hypothetical protein
MNRRAPEQELQKTVVEYLDLAIDPERVVWTAVNPVPAKSKAVAGLSKALGLKAGILDLVFWWDGQSALIELKDMNGTWSDAQKEMIRRFKLVRIPTRTCRSLSEVDLALDALGIPHKRVQLWEKAA